MDASCDLVRVDAARVRGLQLLLDPEVAPLKEGDPLPALWHWVALPSWPDPGTTGHDGHPRRPGPLADVVAVRRMFAGGEVTFSDVPLLVGEEVAVETELISVVPKSGRSGDFTLATFGSQVTNHAGAVLLTERQHIVYTNPRRSLGAAQVPRGALPVVGRPFSSSADGSVDLITDPTVLMRFSSLTANGHRIHYDLDYARDVEKLPGLLVQGPFVNLALMQAASATHTDMRVRRITHRNLNPLYCGQPARLTVHEPEPGIVLAEATGPGDEATTVKGRVTVEYDDTTERAQP